MRIVNIILTSVNGGAEQVFIDYCHVLKTYLNHDVFAIVKEDAPYAHQLDQHQIAYKKIKNNFGDYDILASKNIAKILQEYNADIVIAHVGRSAVLVKRALKKIKNKKIFQINVNHSMNVKRSLGADVIISVNKEIFYKTVDAGQSPDRSFVVNNAIDLFDAREIAPKINFAQKDTIILGSMARLDKAKAFRFSIYTIHLLKKLSNKKFILKIAGSGPREPFLRNLVKELNLENEVQFLGWVKDKKAFYDDIDIYILSSQKETFGLVLLEAMKYRKPIITTDCDGPKEIIRPEIDGLMVAIEPQESVQERMAQAVLKMIEQPELVEKMLQNSFTRLKERYSLDNVAKSLNDIIGRF